MTDGVTHQPSRRFIVRVWSETVDGVGERRGEVRDLESGAFAAFREWSDLVGFLDEQVDEQMNQQLNQQLDDQMDEHRPSSSRRNR